MIMIIKRLLKLESTIKQKDKIIDDITIEKKHLEKILKDQQKDINFMQNNNEDKLEVSDLISFN